ncbi:MAG: hypothetical protein JRI72_14030 [Deltaproteobacteria bacterium]|nr:hypothetical protein [Deltaproteobacteria bacterium]
MNIIYNTVAILLMGVCIFAGFKGYLELPILCFLASLAFLFIANLKNIKKAKASKDGFEFEAKEVIGRAEVTITEMQNLSKLVSKTALSLIKRSGRMGGYPVEEQEALKESFLSLLSDLNLSNEDREYVLEEYNKFIEIDYVFLLLGNHVPTNWSTGEQQKRKEMLKDVISSYPTPEEIESLLERNNSLSDNHKEILEDYKYFRDNKKYRRPEMISDYKKLRNEMNL